MKQTSLWVSDTICAGLELEYEGVPHEAVQKKYLESHDRRLLAFCTDGSLRPRKQNTEVKFAGPLSGLLITEALTHVQELLTWHHHTISWRCGMHVHIDCRGTDFMQSYRAAVLTALLEQVLYAWDGTGRQENKFCQSIVDSVYAFCNENRGGPALTKYSLLNLRSLYELGTLELRFAGSTKNMRKVAAFINIGMGLRQAALPFANSEALIVSVLQAPSLASWIEMNTHPLMAEQLVPIAEVAHMRSPTPAALSAVLELVEFEKKVTPQIIGG